MYYVIRKQSYFSAYRIKLFIEGQAFFAVVSFGSRQQDASLSLRLPMCRHSSLRTGGGGWGGRGAKSYDRRKAYVGAQGLIRNMPIWYDSHGGLVSID